MTWNERMITTVTTGIQLRDALLAVRLNPTDSCIVHTKLSAFGFIPGGEQTVIDVLKGVLYDGDIMMPAQTTDLSDPRYWAAPPVSPDLVDVVRAALPAFDPATTPVRGIGRMPEFFRKLPGTRRSSHPLYSMSAWGRHADWLCGPCGGENNRDYDMPFGEHSPLSRLYEIDGKVLFLGTGFDTCTAIHYAESTIGRPHIEETAPVGRVDAVTGERTTEWVTFDTVELDRYDDFESFGKRFLVEHADSVCAVTLNEARILAFSIRDLVDAAREYYARRDLRQSGNDEDDDNRRA
ncbi:aminoglycoside N(3)-acetyltransferase [Bifidobacterium leontopitheci]|uniref:Aminoglycoside N(3)-acetyltransferase n=1 Tax=Bifidobacterium leontopitheci TaxID=2650774 RepID=A0A6I1GX14_9BIFI|nr:AAC(3) family N-acetyltransferase [Bifidobacterium leontopitheci]KAB7790991.1 AAC(3) family N-acetyltransferase [Bifidobacterium leontopitheci]